MDASLPFSVPVTLMARNPSYLKLKLHCYRPPTSVCFSCLSCCCYKKPNQSSLRKGRVVWLRVRGKDSYVGADMVAGV